MKPNIINIFIVTASLILFSACEKVIDIDLNSASPQVVIEGNIYDKPGPYHIKITKTVNFNEANRFPPVRDASVIIADNLGNSDTLFESTPGNYNTRTIQGVIGRTYTLTVKTEGKSYSAISKIPDSVNIDSLYFNIYDEKKILSVDFTDPANTDNYFRIVKYINGKRQKGFDAMSDELNPGDTNTYDIISEEGDILLTGAVVRIDLESIDKGVYEYIRTASGQDEETAPANPTSNISNGALGYFNACSVTTDSISIP